MAATRKPISHRAAFLQSFHTGTSASAREAAIAENKALIDGAEYTPEIKAPSTRNTGMVTIGGVKGTPLAPKVTPETTNPADTFLPGTEKQVAFIKSLATQRNLTDSDLKVMLRRYRTARTLIDALMIMPRVYNTPETSNTTAKPAAEPITEGMYRKADGTIYKVSATRSTGQLVGYKWNLFATPEPTAKGLKFGEFVYEGKRPLYSLKSTDKLSLAEAKAMGAEFHYCVRCGIELTKQSSIDNGIGPICASKF